MTLGELRIIRSALNNALDDRMSFLDSLGDKQTKGDKYWNSARNHCRKTIRDYQKLMPKISLMIYDAEKAKLIN